MSIDVDKSRLDEFLVGRLSELNPWWDEGPEAATTDAYESLRAEFYTIHRSLLTDPPGIHRLSGPDAVGKSTLIEQLISALIAPDFVEKFYRQPGFRSTAREGVISPEQVLYIPYDMDPLFHFAPAAQLRSAVEQFETHYAGVRASESDPRYIFLDDVDTILSQRDTATVHDFMTTLIDLVEADPTRHIVLASVSDAQYPQNPTNDSSDELRYQSETRLRPLSFSEYIRFRARELETSRPEERFSADRVRSALHQSIVDGDPETFVDSLRAELAKSVVPSETVRRELSNYLTIGGYGALQFAAEGLLSADRLITILRRKETELTGVQDTVTAQTRRMIRTRAPELGGIARPVALEQLCALLAAELPTEAVRFTSLTDLFNIGRRTLRDKYFSVLSQLALLSHSSEYDNLRPRYVRAYLHDPGVANALTGRDLNDVLATSAVSAGLSQATVYDHTLRLSAAINDEHDPKQGVVKFWPGSKSDVDFIPKFNGRPLPIGWTAQSTARSADRAGTADTFEGLVEFLAAGAWQSERDPLDANVTGSLSDSAIERREEYVTNDTYQGRRREEGVLDGEPPFGLLLTTGQPESESLVTVHHPEPVEQPIVTMPEWVYLRLV